MRPTEYRLLIYLVLNSDRVLSHQELLDNVWGNQGGSLDSLKWHVSALREKIEADPKKPSIIVTFPRVGYRYIKPSKIKMKLRDPADRPGKHQNSNDLHEIRFSLRIRVFDFPYPWR